MKVNGYEIKAGADLSDAYLYGADLRGTNLSGADLSRANLYGANLSDADLRSADLRGTNLSGADLRGTNLSGADLRDANLRDANLYDANLYGANLSLSKSIHTIGFDNCFVFIFNKDYLQIGCKRMRSWKEWDKEFFEDNDYIDDCDSEEHYELHKQKYIWLKENLSVFVGGVKGE